LPPASRDLLAPTSGNEAPPDALGASLQSTLSSPFISASLGGGPASAIDTVVRGEPPVAVRGAQSRGSYTSQVARWSASAATASMNSIAVIGGRASVLKSAAGVGYLSSAASANPAPALTAIHHAHRRTFASSESPSLFGFTPGIQTQLEFGQNSFASLDPSQSSFLQTDVLAALGPGRKVKLGETKLPSNEMARLQTLLHPPSYKSSYGEKTSHGRVTMKSLIEQESQTEAPELPPIFLLSR
jgi:hypothetical protein